MKFALHPPIPSKLPDRTSKLCLFIPLHTLSHSSPVTPLFATLTQNNGGWGVALVHLAKDPFLFFLFSMLTPSHDHESRITIHLVSFHTLPHSFHSCRPQKSLQALFFLTLPHSCKNNRGWGEEPSLLSSGLFQRALDQRQAAFGFLAQHLFAVAALFPNAQELICDGQRGQHGRFLRIHRRRSLGDRAHLRVHVRGQLLDVGFLELSADRVALSEDLHFDGRGHGLLPGGAPDKIPHPRRGDVAVLQRHLRFRLTWRHRAQLARSCAPTRFSSAETMRVENSAICASVSVPAALWNTTRTSKEYFPVGTFFPRNRSAASTEVISPRASERIAAATYANFVPSAKSREKSRSTAGNRGSGVNRRAFCAAVIAAYSGSSSISARNTSCRSFSRSAVRWESCPAAPDSFAFRKMRPRRAGCIHSGPPSSQRISPASSPIASRSPFRSAKLYLRAASSRFFSRASPVAPIVSTRVSTASFPLRRYCRPISNSRALRWPWFRFHSSAAAMVTAPVERSTLASSERGLESRAGAASAGRKKSLRSSATCGIVRISRYPSPMSLSRNRSSASACGRRAAVCRATG